MIRQDYIMAIIEQFYQTIAKFLSLKEQNSELILLELERIYVKYLNHNRSFYLNSDYEEIIHSFSAENNKANSEAEMLSELYYQEFILSTSQINRIQIATKLLRLYGHMDNQTRLFSFIRDARRNEIINYLKEYSYK